MTTTPRNDDNTTPDERLIDSLLTDFLTKKSPPDLRQRIESRVKSTNDQIKKGGLGVRFSEQELTEAVAKAAADLDACFVIPPPVQLARVPATSIPSGRASKHRRTISVVASFLALAATMAFLYFGLFRGSGTTKHRETISKNHELPSVQRESPQESPVREGGIDSRFADGARDPKRGERPSVDGNQFNSIGDRTLVQDHMRPRTRPSRTILIPAFSEPGNSSTSGRMSESEIVGVIDQQFEHLWARLDLTPSSAIKNEELAERFSLTLIGRTPTDAERESYRKLIASDKSGVQRIAEQLVDSDDFARYWGMVLSEYLLGNPLPDRGAMDSKQVAFVDWVENTIKAKQSLASILNAVVRSTGSESDASGSRLWVSEALERGRKDYRNAADRARRSTSNMDTEKYFELAGVSRSVLRIAGASEVACLQCHVGQEELDGEGSKSAENRLRGESDFWGVAAHFFKTSMPEASASRNARTTALFREDENGKLISITPVLPNGRSISSRSESVDELAMWLQASAKPREAIVDLVWDAMLGQPLVPAAGLGDEEGRLERADLRSFLAQRLLAEGDNVQTLARWLAASKAIRMGGTEISPTWYRKSSTSDLVGMSKRKQTFADFNASPMRGKRQDDFLTNTRQWLADRSKSKSSDGTLAQAANAIVSNPGESNSKSEAELSSWAIRFELAEISPREKTMELAESLAKSGLDWRGISDHAFLICESRFATTEELSASQKLLDESKNDRTKASRLLLLSLSGHF